MCPQKASSVDVLAPASAAWVSVDRFLILLVLVIVVPIAVLLVQAGRWTEAVGLFVAVLAVLLPLIRNVMR